MQHVKIQLLEWEGGGQRQADAQLWKEDLNSTHSTYYFIVLIKNVAPTHSRLLTYSSPYYYGKKQKKCKEIDLWITCHSLSFDFTQCLFFQNREF